ncbi:MAG: dUTP diphosphatase [Balneolaceae bacterium]
MSEKTNPHLHIERLPHAEGLELPAYETPGSSGMDVRAAILDELKLEPGERTLIPTGLKMAIPPGYEIQVRPRSGLAFRHGITMLNTPGTIDQDYRGEIKVLAVNLGSESYTFQRGERIAQLVVAPVVQATFSETDTLDETIRGEGGFGSTGI